jgi:hypothetical protein
MSSSKNIKPSKEDRREINDFLPYLLSYSVDSLKHQQRNIEVQLSDLKKSFSSDLALTITNIIPTLNLHSHLSASLPVLAASTALLNTHTKDLHN